MIENPVLVEVVRAGMRESFHRGAIAIVRSDGSSAFECGNTDSTIFPRSAIKLFQHIPFIKYCIQRKLHVSDEEISLICGSHNAEPEHLRVLGEFMNKFQVKVDELACGAHFPTDEESALRMKCSQEKPTHIHNNCSGKHSAFLAYCLLKALPTKDYLSEVHPIQLEIKDTLSELCHFPADKMQVGIDGCSAPNFALPLKNLAWGMAKLADNETLDSLTSEAIQRQTEAIRNQPFYIAGTNRYCTLLNAFLGDEVIGKVGAEGVYVLSFLKLKIGVAIKIDDGKMGPQYHVAQAICDALLGDISISKKELQMFRDKPVKNWKGIQTGEMRTTLGTELHKFILG